MRKNIKRAKARKKLDKKSKEKIAKEKRRDRKGAHKEHSIALLFVVPFALSVFPLLPFILVSLPCFHNCARNMYRPTTMTSALDIYSILLSITKLCATYIYLFFMYLPSSTYILQISTEKDPCNLGATPS
jgi:hypothetical protein